MLAYIIRRLVWLPVLLILISMVTFALGIYGPGDPVQVMTGLRARPDLIQRVRQEYGFDQPFHVQYLNYLSNVLRGNFGYSLVKYQGQPVGALIARRLPVSMQLNIAALVWSVPLGIALGVAAALRRGTWLDVTVRAIVILGISVPIIGLMPVLTFAFSRKHEIGPLVIGPFLPVGGWNGIFSPHIILPAFILGMGALAVFTRQTRAAMIETLGEDYIRTARAKGLKEHMVVVRHAMRNALIPLITLFGFLLAGLFAGSFLVESFYGIPGVGQLAFDSLTSREYYIIMAFTLLAATVYVIANLIIDIVYGFVDPRIRYQ